MRWLIALLFVVFGAAASPAVAARLALVIGINDYEMLPPLEKAVGDADAMSERLGQLGFAVTKVLNPDRREFNRAIAEFRNSLRKGDVAFVHFSGHGIEVDGRNLLLPRDIPLPARGGEDFLAEEAIDLSELMDRVAASAAAVRIFVIDACRDNPFARKGLRGLGGPGGLGPAAPSRGSFILYSAGYGQTALDRLTPDDPSPTSVYTRVLLDRLGTPGASISEIARDVRTEVAELAANAGHDQFPAYYDELSEDIVLTPSPRGEETPRTVPAAVVAVARPTEYQLTRSSGLIATFDVPVTGRITRWELHFAYRTECENDHFASIASPSGDKVTLMDRGLRRCTGMPTVYTSDNVNGSPFVGSQAGGKWQFLFRDLDANSYSGNLEAVRMTLTVSNAGVETEHTVELDGLPLKVPNPG
jgi:hypothetical protein